VSPGQVRQVACELAQWRAAHLYAGVLTGEAFVASIKVEIGLRAIIQPYDRKPAMLAFLARDVEEFGMHVSAITTAPGSTK